MNKIPIILTTLALVCIFASSTIPDSEAKLWDFIVDVEFLKSPINEGKNPILIGTVVDHAYRPLSNIDVKLTVAGESHMLKTDGNGEFGKQIDVSELEPRTYSILVFATDDDGKKGMTRTTLEVSGHTEKSAKYERQLESMELANDLSKLRPNSNDPISVILYQHYLKLQENAAKAKYEEKLLDLPQQKIRDARQMTYEKLMQSLEDRPLITRDFDDSTKLGKFLQNLDDEKRTLFELQLNSTKLRFVEAQNIMQEILKNGGTASDARAAYLDYLSITQEEMNSFTLNIEKTEISSKPSTNSTQN
ncbi:MAG: carboxypeptidase-like regulatory domain-containing protein [Thermoproteota archaeon]|nr:carboxypeptidase-like regulatory domain-containing protein [Thermoproteota archaeon]